MPESHPIAYPRNQPRTYRTQQSAYAEKAQRQTASVSVYESHNTYPKKHRCTFLLSD